MNRFLLLSACFLSLAVSAAIITERNDVYKGVGCLTPPQYTFVGTPSRPGIESCWIPYGTYTDGVGGTEYTRVTSNLMGVVASAIGGLSERGAQIGFGPLQCMLRPTVFPVPWGQSYHDYGAFLSSTTNLSYRIADQLNECAPGVGLLYVEVEGTNYNYNFTSPIEERLLEIAKQYGSRRLEALVGSAAPPISSEWSPNLPYNEADSNLWRNVYPLLGFCTNDIHFLPHGYYRRRRLPDPNPNGWGSLEGLWGEDFGQSLADLHSALVEMPLDVTIEDVLSYDTGWKYEVPPVETNSYWTVNYRDVIGGDIVYPTVRLSKSREGVWYGYPPPGGTIGYIQIQYSGNNINFYASGYIDEKSYGSPEERDAVSNIVFMTDYGSFHAVKTSLYDDTDDYTHWTNGTTRLDWKRLGIICQLERQMDTTYEDYQHGDTLPLWHLDTLHELWYESSPVSITFPMPQGDGQDLPPVAGLLRDVSWNNDYDHYSSTTNDYKTIWSTPTCRTPAPQCAGEMYFDGHLGTDIYLEYEDASNIVSKICSELSQSITGELYHVLFYGDWHPGAGMNLDFNAYYAEGKSIIKHPSNTVEVISSDGFHAGGWTYDDVDRHNWDFTNGTTRCDVRFDWGGYVPGGTYIYWDTEPYGESVYYEDNLHFGLKSGSITVPQVTLSAIGSGMITNWTWQVSGLPNVPTNLVSGLPSVSYSYVEMADGTVYTNLHCRWAIGNYAGGYGTGGWVDYQELQDAGDGSINWHLQSDDVWQDNTYMFQWQESRGVSLSHSYTTPSVTLTWNADYYTTEEEVFYSGQLQGDSIPIHWNPESTNATGYAYSTIHKTTSPTFTLALPETRALTISRFSWKNSSLDWDRIHSLRRSELEMLLSARGVPGFASDTNAYDPSDQPFTWEAIKNIPHSDRMFRMLQGTPVSSLANADNAQYNFLADLSGVCKSKCVEIGGMPIGAIDKVGKVSQSESAAFLADFKNAKVGATFLIAGSSGEVFQADVHLEGDSYVVDAIDTPVHFPCYVGGCGWDCYVDYQQSASITNQYHDARVDAHQAPVRKTVWSFKNLRDPNL